MADIKSKALTGKEKIFSLGSGRASYEIRFVRFVKKTPVGSTRKDKMFYQPGTNWMHEWDITLEWTS